MIVTLQDKSAMAGFYLFYIPCELYSYNALIISVFVLTLGEECIIEETMTKKDIRVLNAAYFAGKSQIPVVQS